jgi:protein O-GlcNAc transferase
LKAIRAKVWSARMESPLFDCAAYARGMEMVFQKMWTRYARGEKPDHVRATERSSYKLNGV